MISRVIVKRIRNNNFLSSHSGRIIKGIKIEEIASNRGQTIDKEQDKINKKGMNTTMITDLIDHHSFRCHQITNSIYRICTQCTISK